MKTLAQLLIEYNIKHGYDVSIDGLRETLLECFPTKWQGDSVEYRWRVDESRVVEVVDDDTSCLLYVPIQVRTVGKMQDSIGNLSMRWLKWNQGK